MTTNVMKRRIGIMDQKLCPFCKSSAQDGCLHLALACDGRDFVNRCVETCHGRKPWRTLCALPSEALNGEKRPSPIQVLDFTWIETAFTEKFLKHLQWFGGLDHEWRAAPNPRKAGSWALLWSKDPQRLWWELLDELVRQADELSEEAGIIHCPICKQPVADEYQHEHLAISTDESQIVKGVVEFAGAEVLWECLRNESNEDYLRNSSAFLGGFVEPCRLAARLDREVWTGGAPGLSGAWLYLWTADRTQLSEEIHDRLLQEVARVRLARTKARHSTEPRA
jgi:hypothetical protein